MDIFELDIDTEVFKKTNEIWNKLQLNDPWSVGYVSSLISLKNFNTKEEWVEFYYRMGDIRRKMMKKLGDAELMLVENHIRPKEKSLITNELIKINTQHGRTEDELNVKGNLLWSEVSKIYPEITLDECIKAVKYRIISETWNGIRQREDNVITKLRLKFPHITFKSTEAEFDYKYAVDYEAYYGSFLLMGIQIKPESYAESNNYINRAKAGNKLKYAEYREDFQRPVAVLPCKLDGTIMGAEVEMAMTFIFNAYENLFTANE